MELQEHLPPGASTTAGRRREERSPLGRVPAWCGRSRNTGSRVLASAPDSSSAASSVHLQTLPRPPIPAAAQAAWEAPPCADQGPQGLWGLGLTALSPPHRGVASAPGRGQTARPHRHRRERPYIPSFIQQLGRLFEFKTFTDDGIYLRGVAQRS